MHWQIASAVRDRNAVDNSAFTFNACQQSGNSTQVLKKVTCKVCKPLIAQPRTPEQVAALLYYRAVSETDNEHWVTFECNGCECQGVDSQEFTYEPQWVSIGRLITLLGHAAHDHSMGTEVVLSRHETPLSVYELNLALGVPSRTDHEERWRQRPAVRDAEPQKV
jgi:hypothetical protein